MSMGITDPVTPIAAPPAPAAPEADNNVGVHTATVSLRVSFEYDNEFDYARKLMEVLGTAKAIGDTELLNVDREAGNVRSERRGRDRIGVPRRPRGSLHDGSGPA